MKFFPRRSEFISFLSSEWNIQGAAAELLAKGQAPERHAWRVKEAEAAAQAAEPERWRGLIALEMFGLGGTQGIEGAGTGRLPAFRRLGKGRKAASDGPVWTAALKEAFGAGQPTFCALEMGRLSVGATPEAYDFRAIFGVREDLALLPWLEAVAAAGFLSAVGRLSDWEPLAGSPGNQYENFREFAFYIGAPNQADRREELSCWAQLYNDTQRAAAEAAQEQQRLASLGSLPVSAETVLTVELIQSWNPCSSQAYLTEAIERAALHFGRSPTLGDALSQEALREDLLTSPEQAWIRNKAESRGYEP